MISFVYFDLGGVVELDFSKTNKWNEFKKEIGITSNLDVEFENFWDKFEEEVCKGEDVESLKTILKQKFGITLLQEYSVLVNGFVNRFEKNESIWPVIDKIKTHCQIGLLTNMYPGMYSAIEKRDIIPNVDWDVVIDSSIEGVQKPDPAIFKLAEEKAGVKGNQILFVENSTSHIKAAELFGWRTFLYDPSNPKKSSKELTIMFRANK